MSKLDFNNNPKLDDFILLTIEVKIAGYFLIYYLVKL